MFGPVKQVQIIFDEKTRQSKGYGFVIMETAQGAKDVEKFVTERNNKIQMLGRSNVFIKRDNRIPEGQRAKCVNTKMNKFPEGQRAKCVMNTKMYVQTIEFMTVLCRSNFYGGAIQIPD